MKRNYTDEQYQSEYEQRWISVFGDELPDCEDDIPIHTDADLDELERLLPTRWTVCPRCRGEGTHLIAGLEGVAFTMTEFNEAFDPEEQDRYFHGGYDTVCGDCKGRTTVRAVDRESARYLCPALLEYYDLQVDEEMQYRARIEAERRMGA